MHKLDDFFKNSLEDANEAPDGWNVPSELPWEGAAPHFPKPERKRRIWPFILFGGLLISAALVWGNFKTFTQSGVDGQTQTQTQTQAQVQTQSQTKIEEKKSELSEISPVQKESETRLIEDEVIASSNVKTSQPKGSISVTTNVGQQTISITNESKNAIEHTPLSINVVSSNPSTLPQSNEGVKPSTDEESQVAVDELNRTTQAPLIALPMSTISAIDFKMKNQFPPILLPKLIPATRVRDTREIGLTHTFGIFSINELDLQDSDGDRVLIESDYTNINLKYTKWIGKRWRMTTGVYYTNLQVDLDLLGFFEFDQNMISESTTAEYETVVKRFTFDEKDDLSIEFLPGLVPENGDILNLRGNIDIGMTALQFPLSFDYHWVRPKMEYSIGGGLLLGFWNINQSDINLDLYKDDLIIAEKPSIKEVDEHNIELSTFLQLGFRRKITSQLGIGLNIRYDTTTPIISGFEVGAYYRFTK